LKIKRADNSYYAKRICFICERDWIVSTPSVEAGEEKMKILAAMGHDGLKAPA
jgi:hypothetical protein